MVWIFIFFFPGTGGSHYNELIRIDAKSRGGWGGRGWWGVFPYIHILWAIRECAAQQGMVFASLSLEHGLQISVSCLGQGILFCHSDSGARSGLAFLLPESRYKRTLLFPLHVFNRLPVSVSTVNRASQFFSLEPGKRKLCLCVGNTGRSYTKSRPAYLFAWS